MSDRGGARASRRRRDRAVARADASAHLTGTTPRRPLWERARSAASLSSSAAVTPVRRAQVTLSGQELRGNRTTLTDDQGRFAFHVLPAGRFSLTVNKAGHVSVSYGAKRPGRPGTPIQLADGQRVEKLSIGLPRGGVITGVVVDEHGEPAPNTQVRALRYVLQTGERTLNFSGQDMTDDRGIYRIYSLQPGEYVLSAIPRNLNPATDMRQLIMSQATALQESLGQMPSGGRAGFVLGNLGAIAGSPGAQQAIDQLAQQLGIPEASQSAAYAPVYYPGTATPSGATTISLATAEERSGVDFQLQLVRNGENPGLGRIAGRHAAVEHPVVVAGHRAWRHAARTSARGVGRRAWTGAASSRSGTSRPASTPCRRARSCAEPIRLTRYAAAGAGRGGSGPVPPNQIAQVLWASTDVAVNGQDISESAVAPAAGNDGLGTRGVPGCRRATAVRHEWRAPVAVSTSSAERRPGSVAGRTSR